MKEIYAWAPYFRELAHKVADRGEHHLIDAAKRVAWKQEGPQSPLLNFGDQNIDPFSFFYTVAANSPAAVSRTRIYESLRDIYDMESELPIELDEAFVFPTPPRINTLFHFKGKGDPALLWRLFRSAVSGIEDIDADDFGGALAIGNVALKKTDPGALSGQRRQFSTHRRPYHLAGILSVRQAAESGKSRRIRETHRTPAERVSGLPPLRD